MSDDYTLKVTSQIRSKAGKTAAANMTAEERKARSIKASYGRKCFKNLLKATHAGELIIGETIISCAVLEDGKRVINETSMFEILGRKPRGSRKRIGGVINLPGFLDAKNIKDLIPKNLEDGSAIIEFISQKSGKSYGYEASIIPEICRIFLEARRLGILTPSQLPSAERCEIILQALAQVGITALIDEATGFQYEREHNELQKLLEKFIAKELQPWTKKFPPEFFENMKRMYGLEHLKGNPSFFGCLINKYIYGQISPEVLEELKKRNPLTEGGYRKHRHHQLLTYDIGDPALQKQIVKINTLMSASDSKEDFEILFEKTQR